MSSSGPVSVVELGPKATTQTNSGQQAPARKRKKKRGSSGWCGQLLEALYLITADPSPQSSLSQDGASGPLGCGVTSFDLPGYDKED